MRIDKKLLEQHNDKLLTNHNKKFTYAQSEIENTEAVIQKLIDFQVAIPSWALGTGGTRFGRFSGSGEPGNLEEKLEDIGLLHALNKASGAVSLHIPWDIPSDYAAIKKLAADLDLKFDAVNSNTFQDQAGQKLSYKFGSMQNVNKAVRKLAVEHNIEVIKHGVALGSQSLTVWLSDGSCFPGQLNFRKAFQNTLEGLQEIYAALPADWKVFVEYKAYEPNFYSMTVGDWGSSLLYATKLGPKAYTLVDLGHHLPNANIEQIVAIQGHSTIIPVLPWIHSGAFAVDWTVRIDTITAGAAVRMRGSSGCSAPPACRSVFCLTAPRCALCTRRRANRLAT